jgi:hypothetical protein
MGCRERPEGIGGELGPQSQALPTHRMHEVLVGAPPPDLNSIDTQVVRQPPQRTPPDSRSFLSSSVQLTPARTLPPFGPAEA